MRKNLRKPCSTERRLQGDTPHDVETALAHKRGVWHFGHGLRLVHRPFQFIAQARRRIGARQTSVQLAPITGPSATPWHGLGAVRTI